MGLGSNFSDNIKTQTRITSKVEVDWLKLLIQFRLLVDFYLECRAHLLTFIIIIVNCILLDETKQNKKKHNISIIRRPSADLLSNRWHQPSTTTNSLISNIPPSPCWSEIQQRRKGTACILGFINTDSVCLHVYVTIAMCNSQWTFKAAGVLIINVTSPNCPSSFFLRAHSNDYRTADYWLVPGFGHCDM